MAKPLIIAIVLAVLGLGYGFHNHSVYTDVPARGKLSPKAMQGQRLWQENNCAACHQFYGLGGYLGPDLTNLASTPGKDTAYIKAMLKSGIGARPTFDFDPSQEDALVAFLREVDRTGYFPNHDASLDANGWVTLKYMDEK